MDNVMKPMVVIDLDVAAHVGHITSLIEREMRTALEGCHVFIYGGARGGRNTYTSTVSGNTITIHPPEPTSEQEEAIKPLIAQWNRAKVQKNKNLMRDIERKMQCIRGY